MIIVLSCLRRCVRGSLALGAVALACVAFSDTSVLAQTPPPLPGQEAAVPPPLPDPVVSVFVGVGGKQAGPFDYATLKGQVAAGSLTKETLVWMDGMANWTKAGEVEVLANLFNTPVVADDGALPPPPPKLNPVKFLTGKWASGPIQVPVEGIGQGTATGFAVYSADGSFSGQIKIVAPYQGHTVTIDSVITGRYTATAKSDTEISVAFNGQVMANTKITAPGAPQIPPQTLPFNETSTLTIVDQNTVRDEDGYISKRAP